MVLGDCTLPVTDICLRVWVLDSLQKVLFVLSVKKYFPLMQQNIDSLMVEICGSTISGCCMTHAGCYCIQDIMPIVVLCV